MPRGLYRFQEFGKSHFVTFSCYRRQAFFHDSRTYDLFSACLERTRKHFQMFVYGCVVMPEHVHLLLSEPEKDTLADAIHFLKLSFTKRLRSQVSAQTAGANLGHEHEHDSSGSFWQKRYYDRDVRNHNEFINDLKYIHRNPVRRGLVAQPEDWPWSSYRHYALDEQRIVTVESPWAAYKRKHPSADRNQLSRIFAKDE
jgi:REP-associated tyrosine transposase